MYLLVSFTEMPRVESYRWVVFVQISWVWVELRFIVQGEFGIVVRDLTLWQQNCVPIILRKGQEI
jgi:hypothetical protein